VSLLPFFEKLGRAMDGGTEEAVTALHVHVRQAKARHVMFVPGEKRAAHGARAMPANGLVHQLLGSVETEHGEVDALCVISELAERVTMARDHRAILKGDALFWKPHWPVRTRTERRR
jgi:hypothetical protein